MPDFIYIPEEEVLQDQLICSMTDNMMGFSEEEKSNLSKALKNLFKIYHEAADDNYKVAYDSEDALKAFDKLIGRYGESYAGMNGNSIRKKIANIWFMLTCYGFSCPDTEKTLAGLQQFSLGFVGETRDNYESLYNFKFDFLFVSYAFKWEFEIIDQSIASLGLIYSQLGDAGYLTDHTAKQIAGTVSGIESALEGADAKLDGLSAYRNAISDYEEKLNIPKSSVREQYEEFKGMFDSQTERFNKDYNRDLKEAIIARQRHHRDELIIRHADLLDVCMKIPKNLNALLNPDMGDKIDLKFIESLNETLSDFKTDMHYRLLKANDNLSDMLKLINSEDEADAMGKKTMDSAKETLREYEELLERANREANELLDIYENKDKKKEPAKDVDEIELAEEGWSYASFIRQPKKNELNVDDFNFFCGLSNQLDTEMNHFETHWQDSLLPSKNLQDFVYVYGKTTELCKKVPDEEKKENVRGGLDNFMSETFDTLSGISQNVRQKYSCQDRRKEFFEVSEVIKDTKNRGLFANHDLFNDMTAALDRYKEAFSMVSSHREEDLRKIAQDTKKACLVYLNKHLGSDINNQTIGGQVTTDGAIRKQAVVRMLELMTRLPEFTKQDVPADTADLKVGFKDLNFYQLRKSLAESSGTKQGTADERSYGDLNKAKAAKNAGRKL